MCNRMEDDAKAVEDFCKILRDTLSSEWLEAERSDENTDGYQRGIEFAQRKMAKIYKNLFGHDPFQFLGEE